MHREHNIQSVPLHVRTACIHFDFDSLSAKHELCRNKLRHNWFDWRESELVQITARSDLNADMIHGSASHN